MREHILDEIRRLAELSGGQAPGVKAFESATGISESKWRGRYWARWGDALLEAGLQPNALNSKSDSSSILQGFMVACRHYGKMPTNAELKMLRSSNPSVPLPDTIRNHFGNQESLVEALREFANSQDGYADIVKLLPASAPRIPSCVTAVKVSHGHVYLIKSGDFYKIGRSDDLEKRVEQIRVALPDAATLVHAISTDDPPGIEAYWHRRFADRRANGEWFKLTGDDVKAFIRRTFQ